jgi:tripartite-type tricarboxylate transporter receptor subunit TctC
VCTGGNFYTRLTCIDGNSRFLEGDIMITGKLPRRQFLHLAAGAAALPVTSRIARAQAYPSRPITIVVPVAAGGAADVVARIMAERMRVSLGQPVVIENAPGANGTLGFGRVARAPGDGYTLVIGNWAHSIVNGAIYALSYDLLRDLEPVSLLSTAPFLIVAKNTIPATNLVDFIAWLRANPDRASQGTTGVGGAGHIAGVLFQQATGTRYQFVPYRGGGQAMQDLVAGNIDMEFDSPFASLPQVRAGRIKVYAVTAKSRLASAPDIPTVDEAGLPGFYVSAWHALWASKGTPSNIIARINTATIDALADSAVRSRLADNGQEVFPRDQQTPDALGAFQKVETERWWPIIKAANIKGE